MLPGLSIEVTRPVALVGRFNSVDPRKWTLTVADPAQSGAAQVRVKFEWLGALPVSIKLGEVKVSLPQGAQAGKSVTVSVI